MSSMRNILSSSSILSLILVLCLGPGIILVSQAQSKENSPQNPLPFRASLGANFRIIRDVPDLRNARKIKEDIFGDPIGVPEEKYSLLAQDFHLEFLLNNTDTYSSALKVGLGFRNKLGQSSSGPEGSEFFGYRIALRQNFLNGHLQNTLQFGARRSDLFQLYARHSEFLTELFYVPVPEAKDPSKFPFFLKVGADFLWAPTKAPDNADSYGLTWGAIIFLRRHWNMGGNLPIAISLDTQYHRISSYRVTGTDFPAAGLVSITPQIDLMLVENLWIGFHWQIPLQRPEGREEAFSNSDLAGLYGSSFNFNLKTSTF